MPPPHRATGLACGLILVAHTTGCLDWRSTSHDTKDAGPGDASTSDDDDAMEPGGEERGPDGGTDTTDASDDGSIALDGAEDNDGSTRDADEGLPDAGDMCSNSACPAIFPCVGTAASFSCQGQFADFPVPVRTYGEGALPELVVDVGGGLIFDQHTGLEWERVPVTTRIGYADAADYCAQISLAGHDDFRLPWLQELVTLYGSVDGPGYDPTLFLNWDVSVGAWTATPSSEEQARHITVGEGTFSADTQSDTSEGRVRCVRTRETRVSGTPAARFTALEGGTLVRDTVTKLVWEAEIPLAHAQQSKAQADAYCASLATGGRVFQLPTLAESISIVDYSKAATKRLAPGFTSRADLTWTATHQGDRTTTTYVVLYSDGRIGVSDSVAETDRGGTRCVSRE